MGSDVVKKIPWHCIFFGHKWKYTGRTGDWLFGGMYFYECEKCPKTLVSQPYQGGKI